MGNNEAYQEATFLDEITEKGRYILSDESKGNTLVFDAELTRKASEYNMRRLWNGNTSNNRLIGDT